MSETGSKAVPSEDELGEKWDRCIADSILKTGETNMSHQCANRSVFLIGAHSVSIVHITFCHGIHSVEAWDSVLRSIINCLKFL